MERSKFNLFEPKKLDPAATTATPIAATTKATTACNNKTTATCNNKTTTTLSSRAPLAVAAPAEAKASTTTIKPRTTTPAATA